MYNYYNHYDQYQEQFWFGVVAETNPVGGKKTIEEIKKEKNYGYRVRVRIFNEHGDNNETPFSNLPFALVMGDQSGWLSFNTRLIQPGTRVGGIYQMGDKTKDNPIILWVEPNTGKGM